MLGKHKNNIALFTIAVGKDRHYFDSVRRYLPYTKKYFGQDYPVDYYLFTDRNETIDSICIIPCKATVWPYTALLKTNIIAGYLNQTNKWNEYSHVFFIDADLAVCDRYDFFNHEFLLVKSYWNNKTGAGFFFGGKTEYFKQLALPFYDEIKFIYENKLPVPKEMDEFYIHLFWERYKDNIHLLETKKDSNFSFFYDNEDLDEVIRRNGNRIFLFPLKSKGRANSTIP